MANKKKPLKKQKIRNSEYYDMQSVFDELYADSVKGQQFRNLVELMRMPLEYLYQEYLKKDTGLSNVLIDHMQDAAADEAGRQRKRNRERIAGEAR